MQKLLFLDFDQMTPVWNEQDTSNIKKLIERKYKIYLDGEEFNIEHGYTNDQIQIRVSLSKHDKSSYYPIECVFVSENGEKIQVLDVAISMLDYLDVYWSEYFSENRDVYVPLDWSKHEFENYVFYIRGFVRNLLLEQEAEEFLKKHGNGEYDISSISSEM